MGPLGEILSRGMSVPHPLPVTILFDRITRAHGADLDERHTRWPCYGQRKLVYELRKRDWRVGRKRVRRHHENDGDGGDCSKALDQHAEQQPPDASLPFAGIAGIAYNSNREAKKEA